MMQPISAALAPDRLPLEVTAYAPGLLVAPPSEAGLGVLATVRFADRAGPEGEFQILARTSQGARKHFPADELGLCQAMRWIESELEGVGA